MTPTDYLRQVPIKHWLPVSLEFDREKVITGYKTQRAWASRSDWALFDDTENSIHTALYHGKEVAGFQWIDLPIVEGV